MEEEIYKVACFTSKSERTGTEITTSLWNEMDISGFSIVTIATEEDVLELTSQDVPGLVEILQSILDAEL